MSDVIGSAQFELRATRSKLKSDLDAAQRDVKRTADRMAKDAAFATAEMRRAFRESGQSEFEKSMRVLRNASSHTEKEVRAAADRLAADLRGRYRALGQSIGDGLRTGSQVAQVAFLAAAGYGIKLAASAAEIENAFDVAFKEAAADARAFSEQLAETAGRDAVALRESMSRLQLVVTGTGVEAGKAAEMVKRLTERAVDVGSLFNVSDAEALQAMISGITGETEPLKKFGVVLNEAAVKAQLLEMGFKGNADEASEAAKAIARAQLILEKTAVAQGDAAKTADSAANSAKRMKAEFDKAARQLGEQLLPIAVKAAGGLTELLKAFNAMPDGVQIAALAILGLVAAGGPIAQLITALSTVIKLAIETRGALAGVAAARAAAGGVGAAALGTAVAGVAGAATIDWVYANDDAAGVMADRLTRDPTSIATQMAQLGASDDDLKRARAWFDQMGRSSNPNNRKRMAVLDQLLADRAKAAEARVAYAYDKAAAEAMAEVDKPLNLDGVDLGGGAPKKQRAPRGPTQEQLALRREEIRLQTDMEAARASGDADAIRALEVRADLINRIQAYDAAGLDTVEARKAAEADMAVIATARAKAQQRAMQDQALQVDLTVAELDMDYRRVDQLQRAADRADLIARYQQMGLDLLTAQVRAGQDLLRIEEARAREKARVIELAKAEHDLELARLRGDSERQIRAKERGVEIERRAEDIARREGIDITAARDKAKVEIDQEDEARLQGQFREIIKGGFRAALDGDLDDFARQWLADWASRGLEDALNNIADTLLALFQKIWSQSGGQGGASGGGWLATIGSIFTGGGGGPSFGGARAYGGPVQAGQSYLVGERGKPELFVPSTAGLIMPMPSLGIAGAGASGPRGEVVVRVQSDDEKFRAFVAGVAGPIAARGDAAVMGAGVADKQRSAQRQQYRARR